MSSSPSKPEQSVPLQAPPGTRDFYPIELARRRWIEDKWRRVAIRHGFEEIDGPTFEMTDLYTRKSGDGIVGEIFGVYSGKDEAAVKTMGERLAAGQRGAIAPYALRPEFTPTLARMYAARAKQLPQPAKWFWQQNCYRAERPQRGRLREFMQWNCDIIGGDASQSVKHDVESLACITDLLHSFGLKPPSSVVIQSPFSDGYSPQNLSDAKGDLSIRFSNRSIARALLGAAGVADEQINSAFDLLDRRAKLPAEVFQFAASEIGLNVQKFDGLAANVEHDAFAAGVSEQNSEFHKRLYDFGLSPSPFRDFWKELEAAGLTEWLDFDPLIVRGLAYYTGMVFEVIVDGERAVAGGGRYDNLIETFGGPPTPAVGFGMGDVVLSLVLQDKGLMPTDKQIAADLGLRPDVFVISNGTPESDTQVQPLLASLRRAGMHARRTYKATKNIGKLLKEANDAGARFAVIIENPAECTVKDLDDNKQWDEKVAPGEVAKRIPAPVRR